MHKKTHFEIEAQRNSQWLIDVAFAVTNNETSKAHTFIGQDMHSRHIIAQMLTDKSIKVPAFTSSTNQNHGTVLLFRNVEHSCAGKSHMIL